MKQTHNYWGGDEFPYWEPPTHFTAAECHGAIPGVTFKAWDLDEKGQIALRAMREHVARVEFKVDDAHNRFLREMHLRYDREDELRGLRRVTIVLACLWVATAAALVWRVVA